MMAGSECMGEGTGEGRGEKEKKTQVDETG